MVTRNKNNKIHKSAGGDARYQLAVDASFLGSIRGWVVIVKERRTLDRAYSDRERQEA